MNQTLCLFKNSNRFFLLMLHYGMSYFILNMHKYYHDLIYNLHHELEIYVRKIRKKLIKLFSFVLYYYIIIHHIFYLDRITIIRDFFNDLLKKTILNKFKIHSFNIVIVIIFEKKIIEKCLI